MSNDISPADQQLIDATAAHVRALHGQDTTGHDWWHIHRVWRNAQLIAAGEDVNRTVVELGALLHDIADWKFSAGDVHAGGRAARAWLEGSGARAEIVEAVVAIVDNVSYKGAGVPDRMASLEGRVVQDADRLDALGAVGIGRAFAYGGAAGRPMYDSEREPELHASPEAYMNARSDTIGHFHEKLLLLRDRMHTATARRIAGHRHDYMVQFLQRFHAEWNGLDGPDD
jgi:uncharacterized protein